MFNPIWITRPRTQAPDYMKDHKSPPPVEHLQENTTTAETKTDTKVPPVFPVATTETEVNKMRKQLPVHDDEHPKIGK